MADVISEVERFRSWAAGYVSGGDYGAEWECNYDEWPRLYNAVLELVDTRAFTGWSTEELQAVLYAVARDREDQHLAYEIRSRSLETLLALSGAAVEIGEPDAKWQLAVELGHVEESRAEAERLLLALASDDNEYVRRMSLGALARIGSEALEDLALTAWSRPDDNQTWTRMQILWCLHRTNSPQLERLLSEAENVKGSLLAEFAGNIRRGEVDA